MVKDFVAKKLHKTFRSTIFFKNNQFDDIEFYYYYLESFKT